MMWSLEPRLRSGLILLLSEGPRSAYNVGERGPSFAMTGLLGKGSSSMQKLCEALRIAASSASSAFFPIVLNQQSCTSPRRLLSRLRKSLAHFSLIVVETNLPFAVHKRHDSSAPGFGTVQGKATTLGEQGCTDPGRLRSVL